MMKDTAIDIENLTRTFGPTCAVDNLSLQVPSGIVFGFLGPNGAGKTTTIRLLLGLLEPTHGSARVLGFDTRTQSAQIRASCGALLEHNGLYERLSAEDNLVFYGRIWHIPAQERKARIQEILMRMGLWERRKEQVVKWSRGMKQKLAVARTLLHRPTLVFLDEPTAGLDPVAASALRDDISALAEMHGITFFITTHNLAEAEKLCHQVGVIRQGKLLAVGDPAELKVTKGAHHLQISGRFNERAIDLLRLQPEVASVKRKNHHLYVELLQQTDTAPIVSLLVSAGAEIEEVRKESASLEDVFLTLMEEEK